MQAILEATKILSMVIDGHVNAVMMMSLSYARDLFENEIAIVIVIAVNVNVNYILMIVEMAIVDAES